MDDAVLTTRGLRKEFGAKLAVADLSLSLRQGEVFGFLGPNGAGKTTSLKMLLGLIAPTSGSGTLLGKPIGDRAARAKVGFLPEHFRFQDWLTGRELLRFHGRLYGLSGLALERKAGELVTLSARALISSGPLPSGAPSGPALAHGGIKPQRMSRTRRVGWSSGSACRVTTVAMVVVGATL